MNTEYAKIESLFERYLDIPKSDPLYHKFKEPLVFKNPLYEAIALWEWTEKIDGMNIRIIHTPQDYSDPHDPYPAPPVEFRGRTDAAKLDGYKPLLKYLNDKFTPEIMSAVFSGPAVLYGEGYGTGIQKVGNHYFEGEKDRQEFILFDVFVPDPNNPFGGWWLNRKSILGIATRLDIHAVPGFGKMTLIETAKFVRAGFKSILRGSHLFAEGLVGRTVETLFDKRGNRLITKLKTSDFCSNLCSCPPVLVEGQWAADVLTK
jgi:hypothetical protein